MASCGYRSNKKNFSGLVPVLGNGKYEWNGYLPIIEKPNSFNPKRGSLQQQIKTLPLQIIKIGMP